MNFPEIPVSETEGNGKELIPDQSKKLEPGVGPSPWLCEQILFLT